jgi:hypothetical protein
MVSSSKNLMEKIAMSYGMRSSANGRRALILPAEHLV